jgi:hypothetical protein
MGNQLGKSSSSFSFIGILFSQDSDVCDPFQHPGFTPTFRPESDSEFRRTTAPIL